MSLSSLCSVTSRSRVIVLASAVVLVLVGMSLGQASDSPSLADLARKQRQKQHGKDAQVSPKKVVTNEDLPEHPEESPDSSGSANSPDVDGSHDVSSAAPAAGDVMKTGEQWKTAIQQQKNALADLKSHIDKLQDSIHFVEANRYRNGVEYNKVQAEKQKEAQRLQGRLEELQRSLEQMQESARKAGFGSAVWDP
jgi:uncharacterized protein YukE